MDDTTRLQPQELHVMREGDRWFWRAVVAADNGSMITYSGSGDSEAGLTIDVDLSSATVDTGLDGWVQRSAGRQSTTLGASLLLRPSSAKRHEVSAGTLAERRDGSPGGVRLDGAWRAHLGHSPLGSAGTRFEACGEWPCEGLAPSARRQHAAHMAANAARGARAMLAAAFAAHLGSIGGVGVERHGPYAFADCAQYPCADLPVADRDAYRVHERQVPPSHAVRIAELEATLAELCRTHNTVAAALVDHERRTRDGERDQTQSVVSLREALDGVRERLVDAAASLAVRIEDVATFGGELGGRVGRVEQRSETQHEVAGALLIRVVELEGTVTHNAGAAGELAERLPTLEALVRQNGIFATAVAARVEMAEEKIATMTDKGTSA